MKSANNFTEDIEFTDQLFDELLTELEVDNYTNNDFITFNNYTTDNSSVSSIRTVPVQSSLGKTIQSSQPNYVMFGSSNHFDTSSQASFSSYQSLDYFSNYNNSNNHYSFGVQPPVPIGSNATYSLPPPNNNHNNNHNNYDYDYNNSNISHIPQTQQNTLYSLPPQIANPQQPPHQQHQQQALNNMNNNYSNNQIYFSGDLNERINAEIFKDEENDLLQRVSPPYSYYSQQHTTITPSTQHQPITPSTGSNVPHTPSDDEFVIGAVTLSSSPRYPQYTHQTISPHSSGTVPMNVNLHKSSVKRKNNDISEEDMSPHIKVPSSSSSSASLTGNSSKALTANAVMKTSFGLPTTPSTSNTSINNNNNNHSNSKEKVHPHHAKYAALLDFPVILFQAFNGGDITKVKEIIQEYTTKDCSLKTPSLIDDVIGQNYVVEFFQAMADAHPDAVWVAKKCKFLPENPVTPPGATTTTTTPLLPPTSVTCRIYFAGTRIFKPQLMNQIMDVTFDYHHSDYLFKRPNSSLLDEMDTSQMSVQEKAAMRELETRGKNLSIFGKGGLELLLNHDQKIVSMRFDWVITSFREADL